MSCVIFKSCPRLPTGHHLIQTVPPEREHLFDRPMQRREDPNLLPEDEPVRLHRGAGEVREAGAGRDVGGVHA